MQQHQIAFLLVLTSLVGSGLLRGDGEAYVVTRTLKQIPVTGRLAHGGTFHGRLTLEALTVDDLGQLTAIGELTGTAHRALGRPTKVPTHAFTTLAALLDLRGTCTTVVLDLQPIVLAPLAQEITLVPIVIGPPGASQEARLVHTTLCTLARLQEAPDETRLEEARNDSWRFESTVSP
jgi:hypothetical protein